MWLHRWRFGNRQGTYASCPRFDPGFTGMQTMHTARGARDRSRDVFDSWPPVGLGHAMLCDYDAFCRKAGRVREERPNAATRATGRRVRLRAIATCDGQTSPVERGACCERPRLRLTRKTDRDFNIHLKFTSRTKGCTGAAIPASFDGRIFGRGPVILFVRRPR